MKKDKLFTEYAITDCTNVAAIIPFKTNSDGNFVIPTSNFKDKVWKESSWKDVTLDAEETRYKSSLTIFSKEYVAWFMRIVSAFERKKINFVTELTLWECGKDYPIVLSHDSIAMILAPRIEHESTN